MLNLVDWTTKDYMLFPLWGHCGLFSVLYARILFNYNLLEYS